jgi:phosphoketolase
MTPYAPQDPFLRKLSVGQIYLLDNPLLTERLRPEHVKPRLDVLGHWGTFTPQAQR